MPWNQKNYNFYFLLPVTKFCPLAKNCPDPKFLPNFFLQFRPPLSEFKVKIRGHPFAYRCYSSNRTIRGCQLMEHLPHSFSVITRKLWGLGVWFLQKSYINLWFLIIFSIKSAVYVQWILKYNLFDLYLSIRQMYQGIELRHIEIFFTNVIYGTNHIQSKFYEEE